MKMGTGLVWLCMMIGMSFAEQSLPLAETHRNMKTYDCNGLKIGIDSDTGSIVSLYNSSVALMLDATSERAGLVDIAFPVESFPPLRLASRHSRVEIIEDGDQLRLRWDQLAPSRKVELPEGTVSAEVCLRPAPDGRSVILNCTIENHSTLTVPQVLFPDLYGWRPFGGVEHTKLRLCREVYTPFSRQPRDQWTADLPAAEDTNFYGAGSMNIFQDATGWMTYTFQPADMLRWLDFGSNRGGLSIFQKIWDDSVKPIIRSQRLEANPLSLRLVCDHTVQIAPQQTWDSGEFWLTAHRGGWAKGIEPYREYVQTVAPRRPLPPHIRDGLGFRTIWMKQQFETDPEHVAFRYADIPAVAAEAKEHGLEELVLWSWSNYFQFPIAIEKVLGTEEELLGAIWQAKQMGVNVAGFISVQIVQNELAEKYGVKPQDNNWTYHPDFVPVFRPPYCKKATGVWMDPNHELWLQDVRQSLLSWINKGLCSFAWDVFSGPQGQGDKTGLIKLVQELRTIASAQDPHATFAGELAALEVDSQVLDYTWNWRNYNHLMALGPVMNVTKSTRFNVNIEKSPLIAKKAFADDLYLNIMPRRPDQPNSTGFIRDQPELSDALKQLTALRKQFLEYFVNGICLGDSFVENPDRLFLRGHQLENRLLIIALNDQSPGYDFVECDLGLWLPTDKPHYQITRFDGTGACVSRKTFAEHRWLELTGCLETGEMVFWEIIAGQ